MDNYIEPADVQAEELSSFGTMKDLRDEHFRATGVAMISTDTKMKVDTSIPFCNSTQAVSVITGQAVHFAENTLNNNYLHLSLDPFHLDSRLLSLLIHEKPERNVKLEKWEKPGTLVRRQVAICGRLLPLQYS